MMTTLAVLGLWWHDTTIMAGLGSDRLARWHAMGGRYLITSSQPMRC